jgi:hypothetical protein
MADVLLMDHHHQSIHLFPLTLWACLIVSLSLNTMWPGSVQSTANCCKMFSLLTFSQPGISSKMVADLAVENSSSSKPRFF